MYAIVADGGKQYQVGVGDVLDIEKREIPAGQSTVELDQVLLVKGEKGTSVGTPTVAGAKVLATVNGLIKGKKLKMLKFRRRKKSKTHIGHRQGYLRVTITEIQPGT